MLLKDFISESVKDLGKVYGAEEARTVVMMLCEEFLGTKKYTHIVEPEFEVDKTKEPQLAAAVARLIESEPIQYVLGHAEFYGRVFNVDPSVLIPRQETEQLCRSVIDEASRLKRMRSAFGGKNVRVLDLCTGSGCIAWTVALSVPGTEVVAVDISEKALETAGRQDFKQELKKTGAKKPLFLKADVLAGPDADDIVESFPESEKFDIIVSNPPYVMEKEKVLMKKNVCAYEPESALFVPDDNPLLFYRSISLWAQKLLSDGGTGFMEVNEALGSATADIFKESGFSDVSKVKDLSSKDRFVKFTK